MEYSKVEREQFLMNYASVRENIERAAIEAGRKPEEIELCAVTKTFGREAYEFARDAGLKYIGENRVQEAENKYRTGHQGVALRLIGHLQTNKAAKTVGLFDTVDSLDSLRLGALLNDLAQKSNLVLPVLAEINVGDDPNKNGIRLEDTENFCENLLTMTSLRLDGFMTILPLGCSESKKMEYFTKISEKSLDISNKLFHNKDMLLSMGMSGDYIEAIKCGSTMIRIGTALFGRRQR
ncbi:MAG TPA: YggS family pyridoxal phosphate-dependent enzyme [Clostridiales bacterium]|mgnify:CR=1 FL=1|nr:YggS family pyridoxal phosphate-dependent enzyme [Clostridiales bacterium]HPK34959.1 YggS family pyridoxal phosphate-dependent enzyme [Oscillospiraceae bacterium]HPR75332.1 YggS family pyridoxal phosphate-dependent enzyme [Oscillospiraceae bacterium]